MITSKQNYRITKRQLDKNVDERGYLDLDAVEASCLLLDYDCGLMTLKEVEEATLEDGPRWHPATLQTMCEWLEAEKDIVLTARTKAREAREVASRKASTTNFGMLLKQAMAA